MTERGMEVINGLAVYRVGTGDPVLLMPYPHGYALQPMAEDKLAALLNRIGRQVITFDPPGSHNSHRPAKVDMEEMIECARETLHHLGVHDPIDLVGHSMGGLCAQGLALRYPHHVRKMVLIGSISGWPSVKRHSQHTRFRWSDYRLYKFIYWGLLTMTNLASMKTFKQLFNLIEYDSFVDKRYALVLEIEDGDEKLPQPRRMRWARNQTKIDFRDRLPEIKNEILVCVGRNDLQAPTACSEEIARLLPNPKLVIFENSGHSPFVEEEERFIDVLQRFLESC